MFVGLPYDEGRKKRNNVAAVVCSGAWLDVVVPEDENRVAQGYHDDLYPPGGSATLMRECVACKRVSPPNGCCGLCCDCEIEQAQFAFLNRLSLLSPKQVFAGFDNDREQVWRGWWTRPIHAPGTPSQFTRFFDPIPLSSLNSLPIKVAVEIRSTAIYFDRQIAPSVSAATTAFRKACKPLGRTSIVRKRGNIFLSHGGRVYCLLRYKPTSRCDLRLLPESDEPILNEIAYFKEHGAVSPRARRGAFKVIGKDGDARNDSAISELIRIDGAWVAGWAAIAERNRRRRRAASRRTRTRKIRKRTVSERVELVAVG
jgi:hypothetical protein